MSFKKRNFVFILFLLFFFPAQLVMAQDAWQTLRYQYEQNPEVLEKVAFYPDNMRNDILEVASSPKVLVRMSAMQEKSRQQFDGIVQSLSRKDQERIWNVVRYPDLLREIASGNKKSSRTIARIVKNYPEDVREDAKKVARSRYSELHKIYQLQSRTESEFQSMLRDMSSARRAAFQRLVKNPDVLTELTADLNFTILLGEAYRQNPRLVRRELAHIHEQVAQRNERALEEYRADLRNDPEAQAEMRDVATQFNEQYGDVVVSSSTPPRTQVSLYFGLGIAAYPFWFGHPYWYSYWRPYPSWYHCGCYWDYSGSFFVFGLPSYYYMDWFLYHGHHHRHRRLIRKYVHHYHHHKTAQYGFHKAVANWEYQHNRRFDKEWYRYSDRPVRRDLPRSGGFTGRAGPVISSPRSQSRVRTSSQGAPSYQKPSTQKPRRIEQPGRVPPKTYDHRSGGSSQQRNVKPTGKAVRSSKPSVEQRSSPRNVRSQEPKTYRSQESRSDDSGYAAPRESYRGGSHQIRSSGGTRGGGSMRSGGFRSGGGRRR